MRVSRRGFLGWMSALSVLAGTGYGTWESMALRLTRYDLISPRWPKDYPALNIVVTADFHVGCPSVSLERTAEIVARLNALEPDIICLLGDYLTAGVALGHYVGPAPIAAALGGLRAKLGVFAVLGNHDWYMDGRGIWHALAQQGITVLENSAAPVRLGGGRGVWIAGLADDQTRTPDLDAALAGADGDFPVIMLSHDPATFLTMNDRPVVTLCGHTHGGQIATPWGALTIPGRAPLRYAYGHIQEDGKDMIVTSGLGTTKLPLRAFAMPEIVQISLRAA